MNALVKSATALTAATVVNGNESCRCATGEVVDLKASSLLKTHHSDNSKKTYVYVLDVRRSDSTEYKIHRSHSDLVGLANSLPRLKELFLQKKLKKTEVPRLPDRVERTKNLVKITKYLSSLLPLQEENNVVSKALSKFCRQDPSCDVCCGKNAAGIFSDKKSNLKKEGSPSILNISSPMALPSARVTLSYKSDDKRQISLQASTIVQIYRKCPSGWWYVLNREKSGWFPASYLELIDGAEEDDETAPLETPERYKTTCDYKAQSADELSFSANATVNVMLKKMDGWWIAECLGAKGFVPATYLRPCDVTANVCNDLCWQTMDMKLTTTRCSSEDGHLKKEEEKGEESRKGEIQGIDLMPEEEIIREEENKSDSSVESVDVTSSNATTCNSNSNSSSSQCEKEMYSSTQEIANNENERRTQL